MMIDIKNGEFKVNDSLIFFPGFTFNDFKRTPYFKGQDGVRIIYLDEPQKIGKYKFLVGLFFKDRVIYMITLINCDKEFQENEERKRKNIHDSILQENGIEDGKEYKWGRVVSEYDVRGNISSINIYYENMKV